MMVVSAEDRGAGDGRREGSCRRSYPFVKVTPRWCDAWVQAGSDETLAPTWANQRYDRILFRRERACETNLFAGGFHLIPRDKSDHHAVSCTLCIPPEDLCGETQPPPGVAYPHRRGLRVCRRPTRCQACAKVEPSTAHDAGGPLYYCGKCFEKPRIPPDEAALVEDERRRNLWRLCMSRNSKYINGHIPVVAIFLGANMDAQAVVTTKGAADYVAKYISKYGSGQSVNARIGSLLDDIITKLPEGKKTTVASILAKAFVATSVPDSLCALEAWHVLFDLGRVICTRGVIGGLYVREWRRACEVGGGWVVEGDGVGSPLSFQSGVVHTIQASCLCKRMPPVRCDGLT